MMSSVSNSIISPLILPWKAETRKLVTFPGSLSPWPSCTCISYTVHTHVRTHTHTHHSPSHVHTCSHRHTQLCNSQDGFLLQGLASVWLSLFRKSFLSAVVLRSALNSGLSACRPSRLNDNEGRAGGLGGRNKRWRV